MNPILVGILVYIVAQLLIGVLVSRKIQSEVDYLVAGRSLGFGLATFSFFATWFGAETCVGAAGRVYTDGLRGTSSDPFGYGLCLLFMGLVLAVPLWKRGLVTLADLFRQRYSPGVERFAVLLMAPTSLLWAAAQLRAFGQVLDASAQIGPATGIAIAAAVAVVYTAFGGLRADVITDLVQGIFIIIGLGLLFVAVFPDFGAVREALGKVEPERLRWVDGAPGTWLDTIQAWAIPILGSITAQELAARVLAVKSPQLARRSAISGALLYVAVGSIPVLLGLAGPALVPGLAEPEQFLATLAQKHLPTVLYILFAGALVSAILSTVDSTLLAASALVTHNLILPMRPGMTEPGKLRLSRWGVVVAGLLAWLLATQAESIFSLVESASSFGSAGVLAVVVFGLFTRFGGAAAAFAALGGGTAVWCVAKASGYRYEYLLSLAVAFGAYIAVSLTRRGSAAGGRRVAPGTGP